MKPDNEVTAAAAVSHSAVHDVAGDTRFVISFTKHFDDRDATYDDDQERKILVVRMGKKDENAPIRLHINRVTRR